MSTIALTVNRRAVQASAEPRTSLADFVREKLDLTGTHLGCEHGVCGACTVMLDGEPIRSCLIYAVQADGHRVVTVEGLAHADGRLSILQDSFCETHALQCGYCTPGMLIAAQAFLDKALLERNPRPTETQIREAISGNLCRCTGYQQIVDAIALAARRMAEPAK